VEAKLSLIKTAEKYARATRTKVSRNMAGLTTASLMITVHWLSGQNTMTFSESKNVQFGNRFIEYFQVLGKGIKFKYR